MTVSLLRQSSPKAVVTVPAYFNDSQRQARLSNAFFDVLSGSNTPAVPKVALRSQSQIRQLGSVFIELTETLCC